MTYHGRVRNGQIMLDGPAQLPEGTEVNVVLRSGGGSGRMIHERRSRRLRLDPDLACSIATLAEFHPDEA